MPGFWQKGRWALFLVAVIAVLLIARSTGLDRAKLTPVEIWLRDLLAPLQSGATAVLSTTEAAGQYTISRSELIKQKAALTTEVAQLREKINRLNEAELENIRLRGLLKMKENLSGQWQTVSARVIARDAGNWYQTVTINRGAADGLKKGLAVINQDGLVGQILATSAQTAEVLLILDKDGAVSVLDQLFPHSGCRGRDRQPAGIFADDPCPPGCGAAGKMKSSSVPDWAVFFRRACALAMLSPCRRNQTG